MKQPVIALKLHDGEITVDGEKIQIKLPDGCLGAAFAFESKAKARKYWGKDVEMVRIENIGEKA